MYPALGARSRTVIAGIARALRRGGRFAAQMGGAGNGATVIASFESVMRRSRRARGFERFASTYGSRDSEEYAEWLRGAGFDVHEARLVPRADFIEEVAAHFLAAYPPDDGGRIHVPTVRLQVRARKR